jgi:Ca2+-binding RTX toxin-like protein
MTVANSTISGNSGSGIATERDAFSGRVTVTNSTISGNSGRGIFNYDVFSDAPPLELSKTIVANNAEELGDENCAGTAPLDAGFNIDDGTACGFSEANNSLSNTDPLLDPAGLSDNGGRTKTIALLPRSPAVDLVGEEACPPPATDQRGVRRPQGTLCDSGAFELKAAEPDPDNELCTISGTEGSDFLRGTRGKDVICAKGGADVVDGRGGDDVLRAGPGGDAIEGGSGADELYGQKGSDSLRTEDWVRGNDAMDGGGGTDACGGDRGDTKKGCEVGY